MPSRRRSIPTTVFAYDSTSGKSTPFEAAEAADRSARYETVQLFAHVEGRHARAVLHHRAEGPRPRRQQSDDAQRLRRILGEHDAGYRPDVPAWLELGGVWVTANLRGGGEYGEAWHKAGMLEKKQNVFDDFIAVAEYLVARAIHVAGEARRSWAGRNGGLLVGAVHGAAAGPVRGGAAGGRRDGHAALRPVHRRHGAGSPSTARPTNPAQFPSSSSTRRCTTSKPGTCYPATLVTTADHDDRVVPSHSFKFIAALQAAQGCDQPGADPRRDGGISQLSFDRQADSRAGRRVDLRRGSDAAPASPLSSSRYRRCTTSGRGGSCFTN